LKYLITILTILVALQILLINNELKKIHSLYEFTPVEFTPLNKTKAKKNKVLGVQITQAIIKVETGGKAKPGLSGEHGVAQFLPATWKNYQKKYLATTTLPMTPENEFMVLSVVNQHYLDKGYTPYQVALLHNQGHFGKCKSGVNKHGVKYDSCSYAKKVVANIK
jgi:hypothetical protein